ncbi:MAG: hypothetical protein HOP11_01975 [Saprospiraceae bacterium]|nr:hypothetical protein [Saprospiraceae bacterium]
MKLQHLDSGKIVLRLTALWALAESGLGGVLHLLHLPLSGIVLTGISVSILTLIFYFSENKLLQMTEALILVLIIKYSVSPHTSVTAAIAVAFQCLMAFAIYSIFSIRFISVLLVCILTYLESAFQKIFVLYILYGKNLANLINEFVQKLSIDFFRIEGRTSTESILLYYASIYLLCSVIASILVYKLYSKLIHADYKLFSKISISSIPILDSENVNTKRKKTKFLVLLVLFLFIIIMAAVTQYKSVLYLLLRSVLLIAVWLFVILPVLKVLLFNFLKKKEHKYSQKLEEIKNLFPRIRNSVFYANQMVVTEFWYKKIFLLPYYILGVIIFSQE